MWCSSEAEPLARGESAGRREVGVAAVASSRRPLLRAADAQRPLTTQEHDEFLRLRREVAKLRMERDFLRKAADYFARDDDRPTS